MLEIPQKTAGDAEGKEPGRSGTDRAGKGAPDGEKVHDGDTGAQISAEVQYGQRQKYCGVGADDIDDVEKEGV